MDPQQPAPEQIRRWTVDLKRIENIPNPAVRAVAANSLFQDMHEITEQVKAIRARAVHEARREGVSLSQLAEVMGMSRTGVKHMDDDAKAKYLT